MRKETKGISVMTFDSETKCNFNYRKCSQCEENMIDGYVIHDGEAYYCSSECLYRNLSEAEYEELYEEDSAYWTEWYN